MGNGTEISILKDPWLPCDTNPFVSTREPGLVNMKVANLMHADRLAWDVDLVRDMFNERESEAILSIPLCSSRQKDIWFWQFDKSGQYTVKSAYRKLQDLKEEAQAPQKKFSGVNCGKLEFHPK